MVMQFLAIAAIPDMFNVNCQGPVHTSNFSCAESNANELEQKILLICIRFGT